MNTLVALITKSIRALPRGRGSLAGHALGRKPPASSRPAKKSFSCVLATSALLGISSGVLIEPARSVTPAWAEEAKPESQATGQAPAPQPAAPKPLPPAPAAGPPAQNPPPAPETGQAPQKKERELPAPPTGGPAGTNPASSTQPLPSQPAPPTEPALAQLAPTSSGGVSFRLENADLSQFINLIATQLKMNYIVDPAVKGTVTITTAGDLRREDLFPVLQSVLKINGAAAIQTGNIYRIVPLAQAAKVPVPVSGGVTEKTISTDDRMVLQIIPLRFVLAADMAKILTPFLSESGTVAVHEGGNILILMDTSLKVKQLMEILQQFDSVAYARQRIRLLPVQNNVASGLVPELESIFSAYAMNEKKTPVQFIPLDRINSILAVAPEPSALEEVNKWIETLDQPAPPSGVQTFVYKVQNSEARYLAQLLTGIERGGAVSGPNEGLGGGGGPAEAGGGAGGAAGARREMAGPAAPEAQLEQPSAGGVHVVVDQVNNSLIIQCTAQRYADIVKTLGQLDVVPRQVMIEARVYEVDLTGALSFGVSYYLQQRSSTVKQPLASFSGTNALQASAGMLIGSTRELMAFLNASENKSWIRVLSAPTVLATDNSDAKIEVGSEVPYLTSQGVIPGVQTGSTSVFTNTIQNMETGIILTVTPRITSTGLVSLKISQEVSSAVPPTSGAAIQSPSFLKRSVNTHTVVGDGQTIALGGLISRTVNYSRNRIPLLGDIPGLGALFGTTSYSTDATELIVLLTPHIIKTVEEARDATRELQEKLRDVRDGFKGDKLMNP